MARANIANCQYVVSVINNKLGTSYTVASGTGARIANKNYLAGWIDKVNAGSTNYASQVTNGTRAVNCGTVDDEVNAKVTTGILKFYVTAYSDYSRGIVGSIILNTINNTVSFENLGFYATSGPAGITSNSPTCIGGYITTNADNNTNSNEANQKIIDFLNKYNWSLSKYISIVITTRGTSIYYGGGGYVMQSFTLYIDRLKGAEIKSAENINHWGAASDPQGSYYVGGMLS